MGFVENGDTQLENSKIHGVSEQGLVGIDENRDTQSDSFVPGMGMRFLGSQICNDPKKNASHICVIPQKD